MKGVPIRRCIGCMTGFEKNGLIRVVRSNTGGIFVDVTGKAEGRGAYVCKSTKCLEQAEKKRQLERAFRCRVPEEIYSKLKEELKKYE